MATKTLNVFTIIEREGMDKAFWQQLGAAFVNQDNSLNVRLNAVPFDGKLHIRARRDDETEAWVALESRLGVFVITEREGAKSIWTDVGTAFVNQDGSLNVLLHSAPADGKLHIRPRKTNGNGDSQGESDKPKTKRRPKKGAKGNGDKE